MHLVAPEAGIAAVTFAEVSASDEFGETLDAMKRVFDTAARIAVDSPAEMLMIPENLSSEMIGPRYFEKYIRAYQEEWFCEIGSGEGICGGDRYANDDPGIVRIDAGG